MTSETSNRSSEEKERRELVAVCVDIDLLAAALDSTRAALTAALSRPGEMSRYASPAALQLSWRDNLAELKVSFERVDQLGLAVIRSIKAIALE